MVLPIVRQDRPDEIDSAREERHRKRQIDPKDHMLGRPRPEFPEIPSQIEEWGRSIHQQEHDDDVDACLATMSNIVL